MILRENDSRLSGVCREVEARAAAAPIPTQNSTAIPVLLLADFSSLNSGQSHAAAAKVYLEGPALYRQSDRSVLINASVYLPLSYKDQLAVLAHEVGHALRHQWGVSHNNNDDLETDLLACQLGFAAEIIAERGSRSAARAAALALWQDPAACLTALIRWRDRRLAGFVE